MLTDFEDMRTVMFKYLLQMLDTGYGQLRAVANQFYAQF